ncbi:MAG: alpha/beta hydrolase-fold protein [Saprospiraceae bacterium]
MKTYLLTLISLCFFSFVVSQTENKVTIGKIDSLQSKILDEQRKIWVYMPDGGSAEIYSQQKYPVVYLLDGDAHFYSVVGMIQQLSQVNGNTVCPEMIVVGIPNTNRTRDLTPTKSMNDPFMKDNPDMEKSGGGGETFMSFIEKELIPYIDTHYPTQPYKTLIGHSFGGLTVMNAVINHTQLFNSYISIDPSMWWDNMNFLKATEKALAAKKFSGTTLYLGIANTMNTGMTIQKVQKDTTTDTRHIRSIVEMDNFIKAKKPTGLRYASKFYPNDNHGSVPLIAEYDALRFIFEKYQLKLENKDWTDSTSLLAEKYVRHYQDVSQLFGYEVKPPEAVINGAGYNFMQMKQFKKAEKFFKMNIANFPESFNVYDSFGDYFLAKGDKTKAIENFKKALSIKEYADTRKKLEELMN